MQFSTRYTGDGTVSCIWIYNSAVEFPDIGDAGNWPDRKVHGANMGPTWVLSSIGGPHAGPTNFAIWVATLSPCVLEAEWHRKSQRVHILPSWTACLQTRYVYYDEYPLFLNWFNFFIAIHWCDTISCQTETDKQNKIECHFQTVYSNIFKILKNTSKQTNKQTSNGINKWRPR